MLDGGVIAVTWIRDEKAVAFALINPGVGTAEAPAPEGWQTYNIVLRGDAVPAESEKAEGPVTALPRSVTLAVSADE